MIAAEVAAVREGAAGTIGLDDDWDWGWPDDDAWPVMDDEAAYALPYGSDTAPPWAPLQDSLPVRRGVPRPPADLAEVGDLMRRVWQGCLFLPDLCPGPTADRHADRWLRDAARAGAYWGDRFAPDRPGAWPQELSTRPGIDVFHEVLDWIKGATVPPPADPGPFAEVRAWADREASEPQRAVLLAVIGGGGRLPLADLAVSPGVNWPAPWDDKWNSIRRRINGKMTRDGLPWELRRQANAAVLDAAGA